jgi:O-Antigen ligase
MDFRTTGPGREPERVWAIPWIIAVVSCAVASVVWPRVAVAGGLVLLVALVWRYPLVALHAAAFAALAIRPSLDRFSERRLGLGPFALDPAVVFGGLILVAGGVLSLWRARNGRRLWPDARLAGAHVWLGAAYAVMAFSGWRLYGAAGAGQAVREVLRVGSVVAAYFLMYWWLDEVPTATRRAWRYLALGAIPPILVALKQLATGTGFIEPDGTLRILGTFSHPNSFAQYLIPFVCVLVAGRGNRAARLGLAVGLSVVVALTYSRTAILGLAAALVTLLVLESRLDLRNLTRLALSFIVAGGVVWLLVGGMITRRFAGIAFDSASWQDALAGQSENSFQWRLINWSGLVLLGMNHPWLGHGAGMTTVLNPLVNQNNGVPFNAHDDYVRLFFEGGVVGLACYIVYQGLLIVWVVRQSRIVAPERRGAVLALGAALCGMTFLTAGTTELSLQTANLYVLYGMLAIASQDAKPNG